LISNNFLVQGHHPRSLATEGGGFLSEVERHPKYHHYHHHNEQNKSKGNQQSPPPPSPLPPPQQQQQQQQQQQHNQQQQQRKEQLQQLKPVYDYKKILEIQKYTSVKEEFIEIPYEVRLHRLPFGIDPRVTQKNGYVFCGNGGPNPIDVVAGPWCCRMGGTDTPTTKHLSDGCCQGLKTLDEGMDPVEMKQENALNNSQCSDNLDDK